ncbi:Hypothetical predicted protein [Cloeon dipterum]|uniref:Peptidase S1 domain-containing protein n=1 Tax=Cloeon dipterum TaxID=197152 RepID=A0A8S1D889_9INSE|nr:Hypothetical predicted protein [Cloeon dipterum]
MLGLRTLGLLALSLAAVQATELKFNNEFLTPFEIHKLRAMKVSQVKPLEEMSSNARTIGSYVYGGVEGNTSMPFMAYIETYTSQDVLVHQCSGAIVNESWILTAAQCFERADYAMITIGDIDRTSASAQNFNATKDQWVIHEKFVYNGLENDIALVYLNTSITLADTKKAIQFCCPSFFKPKMVMYNSTIKVLALGFGRVEDDPVDPECPVPAGPSYIFSMAEIPMGNSTAFCRAQLKAHYLKLASTQVCSNGLMNRTTGAFGPGDSGGPIVVVTPTTATPVPGDTTKAVSNMCVAGVISLHNYETYKNSFPFTMTDIQGQVAWILKKTKAKAPKC